MVDWQFLLDQVECFLPGEPTTDITRGAAGRLTSIKER